MSVADITRRWSGRFGMVTGAMQELQELYGHLDEDSLQQLAAALGTPLSQLYGVATFYAAFRLKPLGRHYLEVCHGTACHVRGATAITHHLERELCLECGETSADRHHSLETVHCLGCCGLAPAVRINGTIHGRLTQVRLGRLLRSLNGEEHHGSQEQA